MNAVADPALTKRFLERHAPFDAFSAEERDWLAQRLTVRMVAAETVLAQPDLPPPQDLFILVRGSVRVIEPGDESETPETLTPGACFPIGAVSGRRATTNTYVAAERGELLVLTVEDFHSLMQRSAAFARFCNSYLASLVAQSRAQLQAEFGRQAGERQSLNAPLKSLIKRAPEAVAPDTPLRTVLERMASLRIGSMVVVDDSRRPVGIFTLSDVLRWVVLGRPDAATISEVMSPEPVTLGAEDSVYEAMVTMAAHGIRHVLLVDQAGSLFGVVSERDLFALQRQSLSSLRRSIAGAENTEGLRAALADVRQCAFNMVAQGVGAEQLTRFLSTENDAITRRVIELNLARHALGELQWCWLAFGSEGREEQTFATDQDNGIVFLASTEHAEACRERLLAFAGDVNADLDRCGFPLCKGNIMAGNPEWCLTLDEWRAKFSRWVQTPEPQALLNATIFFDLRALYGEATLAEAMYAHLFAVARGNLSFQRMMAANALQVEPPLGLFRDFVTEKDEEGKAYIDLKKYGARLFVDVARVFALGHGIDTAATVQRLRRSATFPGGAGDGVEAVVDAFNFIQMLRLRHQHLQAGQGRSGDNRITLGGLNHLERRILKESFRQARDLQQRMKLNYQL